MLCSDLAEVFVSVLVLRAVGLVLARSRVPYTADGPVVPAIPPSLACIRVARQYMRPASDTRSV